MQQYSERNQELILAQMPTATDVRSFNNWKKAGRAVMKGEKGIKIWAPSVRVKKADIKNEADRMLLEALGEEEREMKLRGFVRVTVFDVSQTEPLEAFEARQKNRTSKRTAKRNTKKAA